MTFLYSSQPISNSFSVVKPMLLPITTYKSKGWKDVFHIVKMSRKEDVFKCKITNILMSNQNFSDIFEHKVKQ